MLKQIWFNMIAKRNEAQSVKRILCDCKYKFSSTTCNSNRKWNKETCQCESRNWNPSTCISENNKYLKSIVENSKTVCDVITYVTDIVSTKKTNTIAINAKIAVSINCHN